MGRGNRPIAPRWIRHCPLADERFMRSGQTGEQEGLEDRARRLKYRAQGCFIGGYWAISPPDLIGVLEQLRGTGESRPPAF